MKRIYSLLLVLLMAFAPIVANAAVGVKQAGGNQNQAADLDIYPDSAVSVSGGVATIDTRLEEKSVEVIDAPSATTGTVTAAKTGYVYVLRSTTGPTVGGVGYTLALPDAASGLTYTFNVATNQTLSVQASVGSTDVIHYGDVSTRLTSPASSGSTLTVVGNSGGWYVTSMHGGYNGASNPTLDWTPATS